LPSWSLEICKDLGVISNRKGILDLISKKLVRSRSWYRT